MEQENKNINCKNGTVNEPKPVNDENVSLDQLIIANERIECLECDLETANKRIEALENKLEKTEEELKQKNKYHLQYYRQAELLKKTLKAIIEQHDLKMGDVYEKMFESNEIDLDTLLLDLSK